MAVLLGSMAASDAFASAPASPMVLSGVPDSVSTLPQVGELMRLDADQALQHARRQAVEAGASPAGWPGAVLPGGAAGRNGADDPHDAVSHPRLLAMFGTGRRLQVVLRDEIGVHWLASDALTGKAPARTNDAGARWSLLGISGRCARLMRHGPGTAERDMTRLCLAPVRWTIPP